MACVLAVVCLSAPQPAAAQMPPLPAVGMDASPPAVIEGLDARPTVPLEFSRAWLGRTDRVRRRRAELLGEGRLDGMTPSALAEAGAALSGTLRIPVIPVRYADVDPPFENSLLADRLFGENRADTVGFAGYWREVSAGLLEVTGAVTPWVRMPRDARHYLRGEDYGWASFGRVREFRRRAIQSADRWLDFGEYDNDGPDGIPNSGDDDGFVDFVAFLYAVRCPGDWRDGAIWPHRGAMAPFETNDAAAGGEKVRVADYVILPVLDTATCEPLGTGVLAHETAHALGLPDLYDYDGSSQGIGAWGLMGTGTHLAPESPAQPSAWVKEQLGWVQVRSLRESREGLVIPPVQREPVVYRYDVPDGRGTYLLLANRRRLGADAGLPGAGLLVWRIDPERAELMAWNEDERRGAVELIAADGRDDLAEGRSADAGDPFPGETGRTHFSLAPDRPFRLSGIRERGQDVVADVSVEHSVPVLVAEPGVVRLTARPGGDPVERTVRVRAEGGAGDDWSIRGAPAWLDARRDADGIRLSADPGELGPGTYRTSLALAAPAAARGRGRVDVRLSVPAVGMPAAIASRVPWSWGLAALDGRLVQASYGWDPFGLRRRARLFTIEPGERHPTTLARLPADALYAPVAADDGRLYVLARARERNYVYRVASDGRAELFADGLPTSPAYGLASLSGGGLLVAHWDGRVQHVLPDGRVVPWARLPARLYQLVTDTNGNVLAATYDGDILRIHASGTVERISTGFDAGALVALATAPGGDVFAAERGGAGRIMRIAPHGNVEEIARVPGAEFYGVAVDGGVLYALDLNGRELVRLSLPDPTVARADP